MTYIRVAGLLRQLCIMIEIGMPIFFGSREGILDWCFTLGMIYDGIRSVSFLRGQLWYFVGIYRISHRARGLLVIQRSEILGEWILRVILRGESLYFWDFPACFASGYISLCRAVAANTIWPEYVTQRHCSYICCGSMAGYKLGTSYSCLRDVYAWEVRGFSVSSLRRRMTKQKQQVWLGLYFHLFSPFTAYGWGAWS